MSVLECTEWTRRRPELGELRAYDDGRPIVVMELTPGEPDRGEAWDELRRCWLELLPHFHVLDAIEEQGATLLLRYAAIDWNYAPVAGDNAFARKMVATWGRQLVDVYTLIASQLPRDAARFVRPLVTFDVANQLRVGFLPVTKREVWLPREVTASWPACDEPGLVCATAHALRDRCIGWETYDAEPIRSILMRALGLARPRFRTLASLRDAFDELAFPALDENRLDTLRATDQGFGWLQLEDIKRASYHFADAIRRNGELRAAKEGLARCNALRRVGEIGAPTETASLFDVAQRHEAAGRMADALYFYKLALRTRTRVAETRAGIARCQLATGDAPAALDSARAVLAIDPDHGSALSTGARAALMSNRYDEAVHLADRRLAIDASDAGIHYVRGRGLLRLERFVEAREAFDRACVLEPKRIEAMLLRREADRAARRVAAAVGVARPMTLDLPEHLAFLRDPVAAGRVDEVIPALESRTDDAAAQLVLAECLAFAQRYDEALPVYQRVLELDPERRERVAIGRARALLFLERAAEALTALDDAGDTREVAELRAIIRQRLEIR